jgi:F0F1-type ATP synthase assembly protein I
VKRFLRYAGAQTLFMLVVCSWIGVLMALLWGVQRVSPHWLVTVVGGGVVIILGTSLLMYGLFETRTGERANRWLMRLTFPEREARR